MTVANVFDTRSVWVKISGTNGEVTTVLNNGLVEEASEISAFLATSPIPLATRSAEVSYSASKARSQLNTQEVRQ